MSLLFCVQCDIAPRDRVYKCKGSDPHIICGECLDEPGKEMLFAGNIFGTPKMHCNVNMVFQIALPVCNALPPMAPIL